jgi:hypothetical protein
MYGGASYADEGLREEDRMPLESLRAFPNEAQQAGFTIFKFYGVDWRKTVGISFRPVLMSVLLYVILRIARHVCS